MVRTPSAFHILTSKCASRHNGVHFFDIWTSKSGANMWCFVHFDFEMCFAPQRRALFRHLNLQKWSEAGVFCTFSLGNVLRATTACNCSSLIWPAGSAPAALASLLFDPPEPQIIEKHTVSRLSYLFAHLHLLSSDSFSSALLSSNLSLLSASALLCFSSVHTVGSLTSKLPSANQHGQYFFRKPILVPLQVHPKGMPQKKCVCHEVQMTNIMAGVPKVKVVIFPHFGKVRIGPLLPLWCKRWNELKSSCYAFLWGNPSTNPLASTFGWLKLGHQWDTDLIIFNSKRIHLRGWTFDPYYPMISPWYPSCIPIIVDWSGPIIHSLHHQILYIIPCFSDTFPLHRGALQRGPALAPLEEATLHCQRAATGATVAQSSFKGTEHELFSCKIDI